MFQIDVAFYYAGVTGYFGAYDLGGGFVQFAYALTAYQESLGIINKETKLLHGAVQHPGQTGEHGQITNGDVTEYN